VANCFDLVKNPPAKQDGPPKAGKRASLSLAPSYRVPRHTYGGHGFHFSFCNIIFTCCIVGRDATRYIGLAYRACILLQTLLFNRSHIFLREKSSFYSARWAAFHPLPSKGVGWWYYVPFGCLVFIFAK